jgi:homocysteine S-methyltransferase
LERISQSVILADGAMGTMLHGRGVSFEKCFDELNLTNPEAVAQVHSEYIDAGAQLILSNTFGANRFKLGQHGLEDQTVRINTAGVQLASAWPPGRVRGRRRRPAGSAHRSVRPRAAGAGTRGFR